MQNVSLAVHNFAKTTSVRQAYSVLTCKQERLLISGFRLEVDEICVLLGNYPAYSDNYLPTFRDNPNY
jgi:hypothetical protein